MERSERVGRHQHLSLSSPLPQRTQRAHALRLLLLTAATPQHQPVRPLQLLLLPLLLAPGVARRVSSDVGAGSGSLVDDQPASAPELVLLVGHLALVAFDTSSHDAERLAECLLRTVVEHGTPFLLTLRVCRRISSPSRMPFSTSATSSSPPPPALHLPALRCHTVRRCRRWSKRLMCVRAS